MDSLIYRGYTYLKAGYFERAVKDFKFVLEIDRDNMEARKALIMCLKKQKIQISQEGIYEFIQR